MYLFPPLNGRNIADTAKTLSNQSCIYFDAKDDYCTNLLIQQTAIMSELIFSIALKCPDRNSEYRASGPGCPATCLDPKAEDSCTLEPQEGCFCKRGYLLSDGACVPKTQCGCRTKNGDYYPVYFYNCLN